MNSKTAVRRNDALTLATLLASLIAGGESVAAEFDPTIYGIVARPFTLDFNGAPKALSLVSATVFREGDQVLLDCNAWVAGSSSNANTPDVQIRYFVDGKLLASRSWKDATKPSWTASGVGTHSLECRVDAYAGGPHPRPRPPAARSRQ